MLPAMAMCLIPDESGISRAVLGAAAFLGAAFLAAVFFAGALVVVVFLALLFAMA